jgi:hypothetical protein
MGDKIVKSYILPKIEIRKSELGGKGGAKNCRKTITGNDWKLPILQKRYNGYFSNYIQVKLMNLIVILGK